MKTIISLSIYIVVCVTLAGLGVGAGWQMAQQKGSAGGGHGHEQAEDDGHADAGSVLSAQSLQNLGIRTQVVERGSYQRYAPVPGEIRETPESKRHVVTPVGGRVLSVSPKLGELVTPGQAVVRILREPFARPTLEVSLGVVLPATETYHQTKADLRKALKSAEILEQELTRLGAFTQEGALPLVPRKTVIDLRYEHAKVHQDIENLRNELRLHGVSKPEIETIEAGGDVALNPLVWQLLLERNGLWSEAADALLAALPAGERVQPWTVAAVGELALQKLASSALIEWLAATPEAGEEFASIAGMLQEGATVAHVRDLFARGAFAAEVEVLVPVGAEDWDVHDLMIRVGDMVAAGDALMTLVNPRQLQLVAQPTGGETAAVLAALQGSQLASAEPLVAGSGPELHDLTVQSMTVDADERTVAYLNVENRELRQTQSDGRTFRSWALRPGLRYMLKAPTETLENVIVIPTDGVVEEGADKQVFIKNGKTFAPAKVVLRYTNHRVAVLGDGSEVFPGDEVVISGAFSLKLALNAGKGGDDPHAGHNH